MGERTFCESRLIAVVVVIILGLSSATFLAGTADASDSVQASATDALQEPSERAAGDLNSEATVSGRTVSYRWYDMFNVPFEPFWSVRWNKTGIEQPITNSYPYIYKWHGAPLGNIYYYSDCRLNIAAKNMTEINMNERPEFLPYLGTQRGGNAVIDWHFNYMNHDAVAARFPASTAGWDDGWFLRTYGTTTLDKQGAMSVLGLTEDGYNNFATWWITNGPAKSKAYQDWLKAEGNSRLDIYPMYEYPLTFLDWNFQATKIDTNIVLTYDYVTWGMEALMTRWMRDSIMPTEWYFYDAAFHLKITPSLANLDFDAAVMYSIYAYESTLVDDGQTHGNPCWVWEAMMQDYVGSSVAHPHSDFDVYRPWSYSNTAPGSAWYGKMMPYDYTPGAWNLSAGESLQFEWPAGEQLFIAQAYSGDNSPIIGQTVDMFANMTVTYSEPDTADSPARIAVDPDTRTMTFTGPIDMWSWSKGQTSHTWLQSEWQRMGILPYGVPYIEFGMGASEPAGPKIEYRLYDMFEPEFGEWFWTTRPYGRMANYYQDYILWNDTGKHAWLYLPEQYENDRSLVYAPYRWSMRATNIDWVTVDHPYIMPTASRNVDGAIATIDLSFNYLSENWWSNYWIPTWGWIRPDHPYNESVVMESWFDHQGDGYQLGILYNITMNREAAYQWIGIPLGADVATWYDNGNNFDFLTYQLDWSTWLENEANNRLDIYSGYNDLFYLGFNWMRVEEVPGTGEVLLTIAEVDWGYEVLMTRWLSEANLNPSEPMWEDFQLKATLTEIGGDISFDAVGMYNLHAVKANQSSANDGAWVWEPTHIDYVSSLTSWMYHPSEYDPYTNLTYTSWDAGNSETYWGKRVSYTHTPSRFNLTDYMTLTVNLPKGSDVPFLLGQPVPTGSVSRLRAGNAGDYEALKYTGTASMGFTIPDLATKYDPGSQTLILRGPMTPDNPRGTTGLLYNGAPWIEIASGSPESPRASKLTLSGLPSSIMPAEWTPATVTVFDQYGSVCTDFVGTVALSSTDPLALLPMPYRFTEADAGVHTFYGIALNTPGQQLITASTEGPPLLNDTKTILVVGNTPPVASLVVTPDHGALRTTFCFDASGSHDAESGIVYRWDFGNDGYWDIDWSSDPILYVSYPHFTVDNVLLEVMDVEGLTDQTLGTVSIGVNILVRGNQKASTAMWTYTPRVSSEFTLIVDNSGLRGLTFDVVDITTGSPVGIHHERLRLSDDYGTYASEPMILLAGREYLFTAVPLGHKGTGALAYGSQFIYTPPPLVAQFTLTASYFTVWVDASGSSPSELIVSYDWDWGDGSYSSGMTGNHTCASSPWGGYWTITLAVTDIYGRTAYAVNVIAISPP